LPVLVTSIVINYWLSSRLSSKKSEKILKLYLVVGITGNLLLLGYFKYVNFFINNSNILLSKIGIAPLHMLNVALPIGISFFTFTQIAFLLDSYRGKVQDRNFVHYVLFVTFFPHLIAGPIIHHKQMMSQFANPDTYKINLDKVVLGITIFSLGLAKKLLLADPFGEYADVLFNATQSNVAPQLFLSWFGSLSYSFQLYFDFSGYSDMAVGLSLFFGILLPINFNAPFRAANIINFWQRWHISLTNYIGEYLYTPMTLKFTRLGLGKSSFIEVACSLVIPTLLIFLIIGFWHGANWTYLFFGGMHGVLMVINHLWRKRTFWIKNKKSAPSVLLTTLSWSITFLSVNATFVMFRAHGVTNAIQIYKGMLGFNGISIPPAIAAVLSIPALHADGIWQGLILNSAQSVANQIWILMAAFAVILLLPSTATLTPISKKSINNSNLLRKPLAPVLLGAIFVLSVLWLGKTSVFLYFQF